MLRSFAGTYFSTLVCFLIFNVADFVGRYITHWISVSTVDAVGLVCTRDRSDVYLVFQIGNNRYFLLMVSIIRIVFIPLFLFCNVQLSGKERHIPVIFNNDAYPVVFNTVLGITNGYFGSLAMIFGPQ